MKTLANSEQENIAQTIKIHAEWVFRPLVRIVEINPDICFRLSIDENVIVSNVPVNFPHLVQSVNGFHALDDIVEYVREGFVKVSLVVRVEVVDIIIVASALDFIDNPHKIIRSVFDREPFHEMRIIPGFIQDLSLIHI